MNHSLCRINAHDRVLHEPAAALCDKRSDIHLIQVRLIAATEHARGESRIPEGVWGNHRDCVSMLNELMGTLERIKVSMPGAEKHNPLVRSIAQRTCFPIFHSPSQSVDNARAAGELIVSEFPKDIFTEPEELDADTLANLGPLSGLAGIWEGVRGLDVNPKADGPERQGYLERIELQPIDPQTNGPQLFYGLRYHTHVVKPGEVGTYHDQVGYWLWEPATGTVIHTLAIPRAQVALAVGKAARDAKSFEVVAKRGTTEYGICSTPFLENAFTTTEFHMKVTVNPDGSWSYEEDTVLLVRGQADPFHHTDRNTLVRVGDPTPNPLALIRRV